MTGHGPPGVFFDRTQPSGIGLQRAAAPAATRRIWLVIFTDLAALLLAFFVLLFSMSGVKPDLWQATAASLARSLSPALTTTETPRAPFAVDAQDPAPARDVHYLASVLEETLLSDPALSAAKVGLRKGVLVVTFRAAPSSTQVSGPLPRDVTEALTPLGGVLRNIPNPVGVVVISSASGLEPEREWQRSLATAVAAANALRSGGYGRPISVLAKREADGSSAAASRIEIAIFSADSTP